jgi:uncharacterized membrane protein YphA (DoxX/SURF4 family)
MFTVFPDGWPGAGLLLLRAATGAILLTQGIAYVHREHEPGLPTWAVFSLMIVIGLLLLIGLLTRFVALVAAMVGVCSVFSWFPGSHAGQVVTPITAALSAVIAVALICLGPGALSLDARLFGRREIIIPPVR